MAILSHFIDIFLQFDQKDEIKIISSYAQNFYLLKIYLNFLKSQIEF